MNHQNQTAVVQHQKTPEHPRVHDKQTARFIEPGADLDTQDNLNKLNQLNRR